MSRNSYSNRSKGAKIFTAEDNYTVFDLETTGFNPARCKIIEIPALKVRNNTVTDVYSTLINPEMHIPSEATKTNHITDEMVKNAPTIKEEFDKFLDFIGNDILIGHNIDSFDYNIIYDLHMELKGTPFTNTYIDTFHLSKRCLPELENHRLETMADYLGINVVEAHRAENDCYTTNCLYQALKPLIDLNSSRTVLIKSDKSQNQYAEVKSTPLAQNPFYGKTCIVYGAFKKIDTDKIKSFLNALGAEYIDYFCYSADYLILGTDMHKKYANRIADDLIDSIAIRTNVRVLSESDFITYSEALISMNSNSLNVSFSYDVSGKTVCLTGNFKCGERAALENTLIANGAIIKANVIKKLDYLIIGAHGSDDWKDEKGAKRIKAEEYNNNGGKIAIIEESNFITEKE